jgi:predicted dehydrogenase
MDRQLGVGIVGSGFIAQVHFDAFQFVSGARVVASADVDRKRGRAFQKKNGLKHFLSDHRQLAEMDEIDVVTLGVPNYLHAPFAIDILNRGKHVICEKPLCMTIEEADAILAAMKRNRREVFYAEELCFAPKFVHMKKVVDAGAVGRPYMVKEWEKHAGPYSPWFWKRETAGGGIMMDMGCHAIEFCRWFVGKPKVKSVFAHCGLYLHKKITKLDDNIVVIMEFEDGSIAEVEASWALKGGMDSVAECYGTDGVIYADLLRGMGIRCFSEKGFGPNPAETQGWRYHEYDWNWENGYPHEMMHFAGCIRTGRKPIEGAEDGKVVLEIMLAAYHSAGTGRRVNLPFRPRGVKYPVDLWLSPQPGLKG